MTRRGTGALVLVSLLGLAWLTAPARGDPYFWLWTMEDWDEALNTDPPHVYELTAPEWQVYLDDWQMFTEEGEPYPSAAEFLPPMLYTGLPTAPEPYNPGRGGLVMTWGEGELPEGQFASAWKYDYGLDPDLSNAVIEVKVFPPQWGASGQITQISFGIQDVFGNIRSWYWNVGPAGTLPWDASTPITIDCSQTGLAATTPPADGYMNTPGFDITQAQFFLADENAAWVGGPLPVPPPGGPPSGLWNYWHDLIVHPRSELKWSQPPDPAFPTNVYYGWNELSEWCFGPVVADDWVCTSDTPVTDIHWWGSFMGWKQAFPPPELPTHFHILIWTDVPADPTDPFSFSHPGQVIHEILCYNYTTQFAGWDYDPRTGSYEACFKFEQDLTPDEYFYQDLAEGIYWISISACYDCQPPPGRAWGWKTRPRDPASPAPDAAVVVWDPIQPTLGSLYNMGSPLYWPNQGEAWDMAFELTSSVAAASKWEQLPDLNDTGLDVNDSETPDLFMFLLADDFQCTQSGPITQVTIWGSWLDDYLPFGIDPTAVRFTLSLHEDIPAEQSPTGYSMPGNTIWMHDYQPGEFQAVVYAQGLNEGWLDPPDGYLPSADTICWMYTFDVPPGELFQEGTPENPVVYWLDVQAHSQDWSAVFGWKSSLDHWNDDAVWVFDYEPPTGLWQELRYPSGHPFAGDSIDLAFRIVTSAPGVKWSQPPMPYVPVAYNGWDEYSVYGGGQIAADDWLCTTGDPVTDIHWWGSFIGWDQPYLPSEPPQFFHLAIWSDVPAGGGTEDFSHPGQVLWDHDSTDYVWEFVGWDFDPRDPFAPPEATFKFTQYLDEADWFWQAPGDNIYWLSIAAVYPFGSDPQYPFGWKTRPGDPDSGAPDDAVRIWVPDAPALGDSYVDGEPIWWPTPLDSWDLAFELTTQPQPEFYPKWEQPPTENPDQPGFFYGWNEPSVYWGPQFVADDWFCLDERPITDIHWWGSYFGWQGDIPPDDAPLAFHIGIWTDVPVGSDNPWSHPDLLFREWFVLRSDLNERMVGTDYHPDYGYETCFRYDFTIPEEDWFWQEPYARNVYWISIAAVYGSPCNGDFDGDGDVDAADLAFFMSCYTAPPTPTCWRADLNGDGVINAADLAIMQCQVDAGWPDPACCGGVGAPSEFPWGWKTRQPHWNDDAVRVFDPIPPRLFELPFVAGEPIENSEGSWDMAFLLTTNEPATPQACCLPDGSCLDLFPQDCVRNHGGVPMGIGSSCAAISPVILEHPVDVDACENDDVTLQVTACGIQPLSYQWFHDLSPVGPDSPVLTIPDIRPSDAGNYTVLVTDGVGGTAMSNPAVVTVQMKADSNCNGVLDAFDIDPFILALTDPVTWQMLYPCDYLCANDINRNGIVDAFDIDPFIECLISGGCP